MRKFKKILVAGLTLALFFSTLMVQAFADYDEEGGNTPLICGLEETEGHAHTDTCICPGGELICGQTEEVSADGSKIHTHTEECYCRGGEFICGLQETEAHHHTDACYEEKTGSSGDDNEKGDNALTVPSENTVAMIGAAEYDTLQAAVNDAKESDTILLNRDINESISSNGSYTLDMQNHTITGDGGSTFTISGGMVFLQNGTITGGKGEFGGGINVKNSELHTENVIVTNNTIGNSMYGGGIYANASKLHLTDSTVSKNTSDGYGGGISLCSKSSITASSLTVEENVMNRSSTTLGGRGGGIYADSSSTIELEKSKIVNNTSKGTGGGIYTEGSCSVKDTTIKGNIGKVAGGGIHAEGKLIMDDVTVMNNQGVSGAAINVVGQELIANNCCFDQNTAQKNYYGQSSIISVSGDSTFENCQIENNGGDELSATVYVVGSKVTMNNGKITGNKTVGTGAILVDDGIVTLNDTVITKNSAEGDNSVTGGICVKTMDSVLVMDSSNAVYGNTVSNEKQANDLYIAKLAYVDIAAAKNMQHGDFDFKGYVWYDQYNAVEKKGKLETSGKTGYFTAKFSVVRNVAEISGKKYTSLADAVKAADNGDTITLIAGADDEYGNKFGVGSITVAKNITIDMNGRTVKGTTGYRFSISKGTELTLKGNGTIESEMQNKGILNINGTVQIDGNVTNEGKLTVENGAQIKGKVENKQTLSIKDSAQITNILHSGSSFTVDGNIGNLFAELGKGKTITAGKNFSADGIEITLDQENLAALNDTNAKNVEDLVIINDCGDEALASKIRIKGLTNYFVTVMVSGGNIVVHKGEAKGVFLNGSAGKDDNTGLTYDKPVRSFEKAKAVLEDNQELERIYVTGTVTVKDSATWSLDKGTLYRYPDFTGALIKVSQNEFTLENIVVDGASSTGAKATSSLITAGSGATLKLSDGAVLQNNDITDDTSSQFRMGGGVYNSGGAIVIDGGTIQNCCALGGGAVYSNMGTITMESGSILNNKAIESTRRFQESAGGGVMLGYGAQMTMNGGQIKNNTSDHFGGGISLGSINSSFVNVKEKNSFTMNGGHIAGNSSGNSGGGIFIQSNCEAVINSGNITDNRCGGGYFGGGGIYVNGGKEGFPNGELQLYNVVVRDNSAKYAGGGVASCPTSNFDLYLSSGGAIYQNAADSARDIFVTSGSAGSFTGSAHAFISEYMLGGGLYHWKNDGGNEIAINLLHGVSRINAYTDCKDGEADVEKANKLAKVFIAGNSAAERGGGIGSNGNVTIGENPNETVDISVKKVWEDQNNSENKRPDSIKVWLYRNGERVGFVTIKPDALGIWPESVFFTNQPVKDADGNDYVYTVKEDSEGLGGFYESSVSGGGSQWTITNKLVPETPTTPVNPPDTPVIPPDVPETPDEPILPPDEFLPEDPDNPKNPDNPVTPPDEFLPITPGTKDDQPKMTGTVLNKSETPKTGDDAPLAITLLLMLLSGAGLVAVKLAYREKCKENH